MISFASVNAVLFTPALPHIAQYFSISSGRAQHTITWFLIGYAVGQLIYGPWANRFGRKTALYIGIIIQIASSFLCVISGLLHIYGLLVLGRFLLALGSSVGLKMAFTLVSEYYDPQIANQKIAYLMLAFAIIPGLSVALGGILNTYYGWMSCFYACAIYGFFLLLFIIRLPETLQHPDLNALKLKHLLHAYSHEFKNVQLVIGGLLMGAGTCFVYIFAAAAPFIAMNLFGMSSKEYGIANIIPTIGLITGSLFSAQLAKTCSNPKAIQIGIWILSIATLLMFIAAILHGSVWLAVFIPMILIYFGLSLIFANASSIAMSYADDKAHGSAVMNFLNMGLTTVMVLGLGLFSVTKFLLPVTYIALCLMMMGLFQLIKGVRFYRS